MPDANDVSQERLTRRRPLSDGERALLARQAEEMRRWISTHPAVLDAARTAQRALEVSVSYAAVAQRVADATRPAFEAAQRVAEAVRPTLEAAAKQAEQITAQWANALGDLDQIRELARRAGEMLLALQAARPPNWPADVDIESVIEIANDDGLPVVWVPRSETLTQLVEAKDRSERVQVLLAHEAELAEDAVATLAEIQHESLDGQTPLAQDALRAWAGGHPAAAQALAVPVAVIETAVIRLYAQGCTYKRAAAAVKIDLDDDAGHHRDNPSGDCARTDRSLLHTLVAQRLDASAGGTLASCERPSSRRVSLQPGERPHRRASHGRGSSGTARGPRSNGRSAADGGRQWLSARPSSMGSRRRR